MKLTAKNRTLKAAGVTVVIKYTPLRTRGLLLSHQTIQGIQNIQWQVTAIMQPITHLSFSLC